MTIVVTRATGATAKPVGTLYVPPEVQVTDAGSQTALADTGLDAAFTADLLSACVAHERCGTHLYRSVAGRTSMRNLRQQYERFGAETERHVQLLEELVLSAGGDPHYVSPAARATELAGSGLVESTYRLGGSLDDLTAELAMLEAVLLAEAKDHDNWELLAQLTATMAAGPVRSQFESVCAEVLAQEEEHYGWARRARTTMLFGLATGGAEPPARTAAGDRGRTEAAPRRSASPTGARSGATRRIDLDELTRDELYQQAQDLAIEGRSQMTKDELRDAVARAGGKR
jgi:rubrerythrin